MRDGDVQPGAVLYRCREHLPLEAEGPHPPERTDELVPEYIDPGVDDAAARTFFCKPFEHPGSRNGESAVTPGVGYLHTQNRAGDVRFCRSERQEGIAGY